MDALFQLRSNEFSVPIPKEKLLKEADGLWDALSLDEVAFESVFYVAFRVIGLSPIQYEIKK